METKLIQSIYRICFCSISLVVFFSYSNLIYAGTCTGSDPCTACKNCRYCKHCTSGGSCGVCGGGESLEPFVTPTPFTPAKPFKSPLPFVAPKESPSNNNWLFWVSAAATAGLIALKFGNNFREKP